jgi:hypothetical protein
MAEKKVKMAIIAGASRALAHKSVNPKESDEEIIRMVSRESSEIEKKLDTD